MSGGLLSIAGNQYAIGWAPNGQPQLVFAGAGGDDLASLLTAAGLDSNTAPGGLAIPTSDLQAAIAAKLARNGLVVTSNHPTKARHSMMGFESTGAIAPAGTATILQQPQVPFRGTRLMVPSDIAGSFIITDIRVGKNSQLPVVGALPCRGFQENATDAQFVWDTAQISQQIAIAVMNIGGAPATFRALLYGDQIE
jgi:hypothetical protein